MATHVPSRPIDGIGTRGMLTHASGVDPRTMVVPVSSRRIRHTNVGMARSASGVDRRIRAKRARSRLCNGTNRKLYHGQ